MSTQTHRSRTPEPVTLKSYRPPAFAMEEVFLTFHLDETKTRVCNKFRVKRTCQQTKDLFLNGENLKLLSVEMDGAKLESPSYELTEGGLVIKDVPDSVEISIETLINPKENTALSGLYRSGEILCTQNEAEGFRRITYYLDRPDVMTCFKTKIIADKKRYPILLSNGNLIDSGEGEEGSHFALWEDPFKKPCYLYALVAGDLGPGSGSICDLFGTENRFKDLC